MRVKASPFRAGMNSAAGGARRTKIFGEQGLPSLTINSSYHNSSQLRFIPARLNSKKSFESTMCWLLHEWHKREKWLKCRKDPEMSKIPKNPKNSKNREKIADSDVVVLRHCPPKAAYFYQKARLTRLATRSGSCSPSWPERPPENPLRLTRRQVRPARPRC